MKETAVVLLVNENIDELYEFERGLRDGGILNPVRIVRHAGEARCYLEGIGVYENRDAYPLPALVLLDLALSPEGSAFKLLRSMRRQPTLMDIPVIALGRNSTSEVVIQDLFDQGGNAFFSKSEGLGQLIEVLKNLSFKDADVGIY